jgi:choline kinase
MLSEKYTKNHCEANMQAIIMAAGKGSRLGHLTEGLPKSFARIKGYRLIDYNISMLKSFGIKDIYIVTGYKDESFTDITSVYPGVKLLFNPFYENTNVIGSFWRGMDSLSDDFVYLHADTICDPQILGDLLSASGDVVLPVDFGNYNDEAMGVRIENGEVTQISKEIPDEYASGEFIGIAKLQKSVLPDLRNITEQLLREKMFMSYFEGALQRLIDCHKYKFTAIPTNGRFWAEIDFPEDYEAACKAISDSLLCIVK